MDALAFFRESHGQISEICPTILITEKVVKKRIPPPLHHPHFHNELQTCFGADKLGPVCESKEVKRLAGYKKSTFWLTSSAELAQNKPLCISSQDPFVVFCLYCLSTPKLAPVANQFAPLCALFSLSPKTEHDTRVIAKERQKKDNHNLSKCLPSPAFKSEPSPPCS